MTDPNETFVESAVNPYLGDRTHAKNIAQALIFKSLAREEDDLSRQMRNAFNKKVDTEVEQYRRTYPTGNTVLKVEVNPERLAKTLGPVLYQHWKNEVSIEAVITEKLKERNAKIYEDHKAEPYVPAPKLNGHYLVRYVDGFAAETIKIEPKPLKPSLWSRVKVFFKDIFKRGQL